MEDNNQRRKKMTLVINNNQYTLINFGFSIGNNNDQEYPKSNNDTLQQRIDCKCDANIDIEDFVEKMTNDFDGTLEIRLGSNIYHFTGYTFNYLNLSSDFNENDEENVSILLSFTKDSEKKE